MRRILMFLTLALVGCGQNVPKVSLNPQSQGVSQGDMAFLQQINEEESDALTAAHSATKPSLLQGQPDDKLQKMEELVQKSGCKLTGQDPPIKYNQDWQAELDVMSAGCPIELHQTQTFSISRRRWSVQDRFVTHGNAFSKLSRFHQLGRYGEIQASDHGKTTTVQGTINYVALVIDGVGPIRARVNTTQRYANAKGGGAVVLDLAIAGHIMYVAAATWTLANPTPIYRLNGKIIDHDTFLSLFSAFDLDEVIDVSLAIR